MQVDETKPVSESLSDKKQEQKDGMLPAHLFAAKTHEVKLLDFYNTFWSLQLPFSRPPLFASPETFSRFKEAVGKVLPVIDEATAKERALMGSRSGSTSTASAPRSLKRKRGSEPNEETTATEYFFAKFLTSPELLDLEVCSLYISGEASRPNFAFRSPTLTSAANSSSNCLFSSTTFFCSPKIHEPSGQPPETALSSSNSPSNHQKRNGSPTP